MCSCTHSTASVVVFLSCFIWSLFKNIHRWLKTVGIEQPQKLSFSAPTISLPYSQPRSFQKYISFFWLFTKTLFSHKRLSHTIFSLFPKRRPPTFFWEKLFSPTPPAACSAFHIFLLPSLVHTQYIYAYTYFSKFKTILLGQASGHLCWLQRGSVGFAGYEVGWVQDVYFSCYIIMMIRILTTI